MSTIGAGGSTSQTLSTLPSNATELVFVTTHGNFICYPKVNNTQMYLITYKHPSSGFIANGYAQYEPNTKAVNFNLFASSGANAALTVNAIIYR